MRLKVVDVPVNILKLPSEVVDFFGKVANIHSGVVNMVNIASQVVVLILKSLDDLSSFPIFVSQIVDF